MQGFPQKQRSVHQRVARVQFVLLPHSDGTGRNDAEGSTIKGPQDRGLLSRARNGPAELDCREVWHLDAQLASREGKETLAPSFLV